MNKPSETIKKPVAIVLADKTVDGELREIFGKTEASSLVVAGRSVIEHALLELQEVGIEQCIVLAGKNAEEVLTMVGNDGRWGMTVTVMNYACSTEQILREFKVMSEPNGLLVVEADKLRSHCIQNFLERCGESDYTLLEATDLSGPIGITLLKPTQVDFVLNAMPIVMDSVRLSTFSSARDFHCANFDLVAGEYFGLEPSVVVNSQFGRRQHWSSNVSKGVSGNWSESMIEKHCQVGRSVCLNSAILNHDVYIEDRACLDHTVVMPNSVISSKEDLHDSIVHQGVVYQLS